MDYRTEEVIPDHPKSRIFSICNAVGFFGAGGTIGSYVLDSHFSFLGKTDPFNYYFLFVGAALGGVAGWLSYKMPSWCCPSLMQEDTAHLKAAILIFLLLNTNALAVPLIMDLCNSLLNSLINSFPPDRITGASIALPFAATAAVTLLLDNLIGAGHHVVNNVDLKKCARRCGFYKERGDEYEVRPLSGSEGYTLNYNTSAD